MFEKLFLPFSIFGNCFLVFIIGVLGNIGEEGG